MTIAHKLRDLDDDLRAGYLDVPCELLTDGRVSPHDRQAHALRAWVRDRVEPAPSYFTTGRQYLARTANAHCRRAGHAYIARFEWVLDAVERIADDLHHERHPDCGSTWRLSERPRGPGVRWKRRLPIRQTR